MRPAPHTGVGRTVLLAHHRRLVVGQQSRPTSGEANPSQGDTVSYTPARTAAAVAVLPPAPTAAAPARRTTPVPVRHAAEQVGPIEISPVTAGCMAVYRDPAGYLAGDRGATAVVQVHRRLPDGRWSVTFPCESGGWPRWPEAVHGDYLVAIPPQALMADVTAAVATAAAAGVRGPALLRALAAAC